MKNAQGKIILVDGIAGSGKSTFIENSKKNIEGVLDVDSKEITESLYSSKVEKKKNYKNKFRPHYEFKPKYESFKKIQERDVLQNLEQKVREGSTIIIDRDIIGALAFYMYYFDEVADFDKKYNDKNKKDFSLDRFFGDKTKFTKFYEDEKNITEGNNFEILINRNAIKNIIKERIKSFPKGVKKELHYFSADKEVVRERLKNRSENKNSGTKNKHYEDLIKSDEYYDRYEYAIDLAFLLFSEVLAEEGELHNRDIKQTNTSNFKTNKI